MKLIYLFGFLYLAWPTVPSLLFLFTFFFLFCSFPTFSYDKMTFFEEIVNPLEPREKLFFRHKVLKIFLSHQFYFSMCTKYKKKAFKNRWKLKWVSFVANFLWKSYQEINRKINKSFLEKSIFYFYCLQSPSILECIFFYRQTFVF